MKKELTIAIWGYGKPLVNILPTIIANGIKVAYVRFDRMREDADILKSEIESVGLKVYGNDYPKDAASLIFVINYNSIISNEELALAVFLNFHVGILPKWRGNSANGWGIINGENEVGYTLHRIIPDLDAGNIYYQYTYPYSPNETYYNARIAMDNDLHKNICSVIRKVYDYPDDYCKLNNGPFVYCNKFRPIDGDISDWKYTTDELIRRHYVFAPPLGTGLKFASKGKIYEIQALSAIDNFAKSTGIPGGVVYFHGQSVWVKTTDTAISLDRITYNGKIIDCRQAFIIGQRLGY